MLVFDAWSLVLGPWSFAVGCSVGVLVVVGVGVVVVLVDVAGGVVVGGVGVCIGVGVGCCGVVVVAVEQQLDK